MIEYVAGFLFSENTKEVLLILKKKPPWQAGYYNAIGGKIEKNEMPHVAMAREFKEETGMEDLIWRFFCLLEHNTHDWKVRFFVAKGNLSLATRMEDESPVICQTYNLPVNIISNLRWLVPLALDRSRAVVERAIDFSKKPQVG